MKNKISLLGAAVAALVISAPLFAFEIAHDLPFREERTLQNLVSEYNQKNKTQIRLRRLQGNNVQPGVLNVLSSPDAVLLNPKQYTPLYKMMANAKQPLKTSLVEHLKHGTTDRKGNVVALPLFYSTPVLFYNKAHFNNALIPQIQTPATWQEMQNMLALLQDSGSRCPYTSTWPAWVHMDNVSAVSQEYASSNNQLKMNGLSQMRHIALMTTWQQALFFKTFGNENNAIKEFYNGHCSILSADASAYATLKLSNVALDFTFLPHHNAGPRGATLTGGAALWVSAGKKQADYKAAAAFVQFLLEPKTQLYLTQNAGTLPYTSAGQKLALKDLPTVDKALLNLELKSLKSANNLRVAKIAALRQIVDEELSDVWAGKKTAKTGLDMAETRGNDLLKRRAALKKNQPF